MSELSIGSMAIFLGYVDRCPDRIERLRAAELVMIAGHEGEGCFKSFPIDEEGERLPGRDDELVWKEELLPLPKTGIARDTSERAMINAQDCRLALAEVLEAPGSKLFADTRDRAAFTYVTGVYATHLRPQATRFLVVMTEPVGDVLPLGGQLRGLDAELSAAETVKSTSFTAINRRVATLAKLSPLANQLGRLPIRLHDAVKAIGELQALVRGRPPESILLVSDDLSGLERRAIQLLDVDAHFERQLTALDEQVGKERARLDELEERLKGEATGQARTKCVEWIEHLKGDIQYGQSSLPVGRKTHPTIEEIARRYLGRMEEGGGKNLVAKRRQLRDKLIPALGKERADTLSDQRVNGYKKRRLTEGAQPGTVNRELATLKHMLRDAAQAKDIPLMPCRIAMLDEPEGRIVVISDAQERALLQAAIEDHDPHLWLFIQFGLNTAMRHSEMLSARFDQIDWTLNTLFVPKAKAGARQQPLTRTLVEILRAERDHRDDKNGFIFPTLMPGLSLSGHRSHFTDPFERCVKRAGVGPARITPHVMRHTAITRLVE